MKETYFIDTTKGPKIITRYTFNFKPLLIAILIIAVVMSTICVAVANAPKIKVSCTNANILVFQDMENNYLAYVSLANAEQLEQIKSLNVMIDPSVEDFKLCSTEVHYYKLRTNNELYFVPGPDVKIPPEYNYILTAQEELEVIQASSKEVQYLYTELNKIFHIV